MIFGPDTSGYLIEKPKPLRHIFTTQIYRDFERDLTALKRASKRLTARRLSIESQLNRIGKTVPQSELQPSVN